MIITNKKYSNFLRAVIFYYLEDSNQVILEWMDFFCILHLDWFKSTQQIYKTLFQEKNKCIVLFKCAKVQTTGAFCFYL